MIERDCVVSKKKMEEKFILSNALKNIADQ